MPLICNEPYTDRLESTMVAVQAEAPAVGFLVVRISPAASVATHKVVDGHETSPRPAWHIRWGSEHGRQGVLRRPRVHADAPPVGFVEVSRPASVPTATHSDSDGHDTPLGPTPGATGLSVQADAPPVGSVDVKTPAPVGSFDVTRPE
jgi:hypothetical protein